MDAGKSIYSTNDDNSCKQNEWVDRMLYHQ